jgi:hypothetical protein
MKRGNLPSQVVTFTWLTKYNEPIRFIHKVTIYCSSYCLDTVKSLHPDRCLVCVCHSILYENTCKKYTLTSNTMFHAIKNKEMKLLRQDAKVI